MQKVTLDSVLTSVDRYKLFYYQTSKEDLDHHLGVLRTKKFPLVDVGREIAAFVKQVADDSYLHFETYEYTRNMLDSSKKRISQTGNEVVVLYNFGILLEPLLELDPVQLFREFSKTTALVLMWEHNVSPTGILSWDTQRNEFYFDFSDLQLKHIQDAL